MDRKLNVLISFAAIYTFILSVGTTTHPWGILGGLLFSFLFSLFAFLFRQLTLDGMVAATIAGAVVFGIGGWPGALVVLFFFVSSSLISADETDDTSFVRRNGLQVWANGFWLVVCLLLFALYGELAFLVGALAAIATATADTWATELRSRLPESTVLVTTFELVTPGTDGGVSLKGTFWSLAGSTFTAGIAVIVFSLPLSIFFCILAAGFLGCLLDSYLGAVFQRNSTSAVLPGTGHTITIGNNLVNALSTGAGALLGLILKMAIT